MHNCKRMQLCCCLGFELDFPRTFSAIKWLASGEHGPPRSQFWHLCHLATDHTQSEVSFTHLAVLPRPKAMGNQLPQILPPKTGSPWRNQSQPSLVARLSKDSWSRKRGKEKQAGQDLLAGRNSGWENLRLPDLEGGPFKGMNIFLPFRV